MSQSEVICVDQLTKEFITSSRRGGFGFFGTSSSSNEKVTAVENLSFAIAKGERVAFIGPNGAGKSTTIKMLVGILRPTSGTARVLGKVPWLERQSLAFKLGCVFGQRSQLWYHLPVRDSLRLLGHMYDLSTKEFQDRLSKLVDVFNLAPLLTRRTSQLSLGERMRCEIAASLLHRPELILLDEPSIGLDVVARTALRDLIRSYSENEGTTIILTSHDTGDIEGVCNRSILIDHGKLALDSSIDKLRDHFGSKRTIQVLSELQTMEVNVPGISLIQSKPYQFEFEVDQAILPVSQAVALILKDGQVRDITIESIPLETVLSRLYKEGR